MEDLIGRKFNRLTVISLHHKKKFFWHGRSQGYHYYYLCKCDCGNEVIVDGGHLKTGHSRSCGCQKIEELVERRKIHGLSNTRLADIFSKMKARCYNVNNPKYYRYGARGIKICDEWLNNPKSFYEWALENNYNDNLTIDRINNDGDYEPNNCRWTDIYTQANNRSTNHYITYNGETHTITEWSKIVNIPIYSLRYRVKNKWDIDTMMTKPIRGFKCKK